MRKLAARAASFCGRCKPRPDHGSSNATSVETRSPSGGRRGCEQPRCARGNPKAAAAGGNEDDEGGRGSPERRLRTAIVGASSRARGAAHEATATKLPTKHNTQFNGSEHTQCPPRKTYFTATCPAAPPGTGFPIPAQRSNQAHGRPSLLPAQLHRHPLLQQHAAIRFDHIQIVDRPSRYCVCDSFAARAADATAASCARVWSARIRRFARLSSTSRNAFSTVCRYSATSSS